MVELEEESERFIPSGELERESLLERVLDDEEFRLEFAESDGRDEELELEFASGPGDAVEGLVFGASERAPEVGGYVLEGELDGSEVGAVVGEADEFEVAGGTLEELELGAELDGVREPCVAVALELELEPGELLDEPGEVLDAPGEVLDAPGEVLDAPGEVLLLLEAAGACA